MLKLITDNRQILFHKNTNNTFAIVYKIHQQFYTNCLNPSTEIILKYLFVTSLINLLANEFLQRQRTNEI